VKNGKEYLKINEEMKIYKINSTSTVKWYKYTSIDIKT